MAIDSGAFHALIEESQDLQSDAMRESRASLPDLADIREERRNDEVDPEESDAFVVHRSKLVRTLGLHEGGFARKGALAGGLGAALAAVLVAPAGAAKGSKKKNRVDVQMLQTASSIEILAIATYEAALTLPFISGGNPVIVKFAETTKMQHDEHRKGFQAQTKTLGGKVQSDPNAKYVPIVEAAKPTLKTPLDVVKLAATLEQVATETYLADLPMFVDTRSRAYTASVMGVECQHLATLRAVRALIEGGAPALIAIPVDAGALPAAAGSVAFPDPFSGTTMASPPEEGAKR